ncbi:MAG: XRE family transcriptional regulator [Pseudomonadota bacterium]|nr:XRE family transcriptional regulator [Pseudomonadota bacterium]
MAKQNSSSGLNAYLGLTIKELRTQHNLTIAEVSKLVGISRGMLSKIENGLTSTSMETLEHIANALGVTLSRLFEAYNKPIESAQFVKSGKGLEVVRRGTKSGHTYHLLAYDHGPSNVFEPFLISLEEAEEFSEFQHTGIEFLYMLEGELEYIVGDETFTFQPGDSLTFNAAIPHQPGRQLKTPIRYLAIMNHSKAHK